MPVVTVIQAEGQLRRRGKCVARHTSQDTDAVGWGGNIEE
jgi:hypothetical protein